MKFNTIRNKNIIISILIIVAVLIVTVGGWAYLHFIQNNQFNSNTIVDKEELISRLQTYHKSAEELSVQGDYDGAQKSYDEAIKKESEPKIKADLYSGKASLAINASKYEEVYEFAKQAESLYPTFNSADVLALGAEKTNRLDEALKYYKLAFERIPQNTADTMRDTTRLNQKITELEKNQ